MAPAVPFAIPPAPYFEDVLHKQACKRYSDQDYEQLDFHYLEIWAYKQRANGDIGTIQKGLQPLPTNEVQDWLHQNGAHDMAPKLARLPPDSKLCGGIRLLVQQWPEKWQRDSDTASVLPRSQNGFAAMRETGCETRHTSVDSQASEGKTYSHIADGDRFPFCRDTLQEITETLHLPQSYFHDFAGRYSVPLRLKWVEYGTDAAEMDKALSIVVQSPKYTGDDSFISTALSYDPVLNVTSGYLGYIFDEAKEGKGTMDSVISDLETGAALLSAHPLLLPTLILKSWCDYYHEQLETSRLTLHEVELQTRILEDRFTIKERLSYDDQAQTTNESKSTEQEEQIIKASYNKIHKDLSAQHERLLNESFPFANDFGVSCLDALGKVRFLVDKVLDVEHKKIEDLEDKTQRTIKDFEEDSRSVIELKIGDLDDLQRQMVEDVSKETERRIWAVVEKVVDCSVYAVTRERIQLLVRLVLEMSEDLESNNTSAKAIVEKHIKAIADQEELQQEIIEMLKYLQHKVMDGEEQTRRMIDIEVDNEHAQTRKDIESIIETKEKIIQEMVDRKNLDRDQLTEQQLEGYLLHLNGTLSADDQRRQRLLSRMTVAFNRLYNIIQFLLQQHDVKNSQAISLSARHDNSVMKSISLLSMIFLPGTATIFGMPPFFTATDDSFTVSPFFIVYWEWTLPVTFLVIIFWRVWLWYSDPQRGNAKGNWESLLDLFWPFWPRTSKRGPTVTASDEKSPSSTEGPLSNRHSASVRSLSLCTAEPLTMPNSRMPYDGLLYPTDSSESKFNGKEYVEELADPVSKRSLVYRIAEAFRQIFQRTQVPPSNSD
ncbi:hypothetical protein MMC11_007710, partial [Xylographa trunciseda]|nr:hypothetical protein [Xylographa trunciseda]